MSKGLGSGSTVPTVVVDNIHIVTLCHGGGWSRKINAWYLNTHMVYL